MAVKKQYLKSKPVCRVRFALAKSMCPKAQTAALVGDFNDWDPTRTPMQALKKGGFSAVLDLAPGSRYEFRYLLDGQFWLNDQEADGVCASPYGSENSVLEL
ncbi:MAG: isoamylase early set domain-containing protein [Thermodesulfobacteriota bacterium]